MRNGITSPALASLGSSIEEMWKKILVKPEKYLIVDPGEFLKPVNNFEDTRSIEEYLSKRYW